jgi:Leucine-rich repeat (LRR) protein
VLIANDISDMGALSVLNLASNSLGELVLPEGWTSGPNAGFSAMEYMHADGRKQNQHPGKPEGIIAVANAIKDMRAMTKLDMSNNSMASKVAGEAIGEMLGANNTVLKDLNVSSNGFFGCDGGPGFALGISKGLVGNGALTSLNISDNDLTNLGRDMSGKSREHVFGLLI